MAHREELRNSEIMRDTRQRGTSVALSSVVCLVSFAFMGCFITTDIDVPDPPLCPPVVQAVAVNGMPRGLGEVIQIDPTEGMMTSFRVSIRDCNQGQAIRTLVALNWNGEPASLLGTVIDRDENVPRLEGDPEVADYEFVVMHGGGLTDDECHKLQLFLTSEFTFEMTGPATAGDFTEITWWLMVDSDPTDPPDLLQCQ